MSGAHLMSRDWIMKRVKAGQSVLDAGSGSGAHSIAMLKAGAKVFSVDMNPARGVERKPDLVTDLTDVPWRWARTEQYDVVVSTYCLQHLLGRESAAWAEIGRILKKGGRLLATGRYRLDVPYFEWDRNDPLRGDNRQSLIGICSASGLKLVDFQTVTYTDIDYKVEAPEKSTAWALEAVCTKGHKDLS
jgi:SAM-dependent methyltransferase